MRATEIMRGFALLMAVLVVGNSFAAPPTTAPEHPGQDRPRTRAATEPAEGPKTTEHAILIDGQSLSYRATAGQLPQLDENGKPTGQFFYVAYEKLPPDIHRPLTFIFNGGPGAAAVWLHIGTAGPRRVFTDPATPDGVTPPASPGKLVDNPQTWLAVSDLVFIDPIGTGYSRLNEDQKSRDVYSTEGDIRSVGEFIRLYLTRNNRWSSPKFLIGESYGTTRAAALSNFLADRFGVAVNGITLISTVLDFATLSPSDSNDLPYELYLPTYAAVAHFHKKLDGDLAKLLPEVEQYALGEYTAILAKGGSLTEEERKSTADKLAGYTGLKPQYILDNDLRIDPGRFEHELLKDQRKVIGRFDARITAYEEDPAGSDPRVDPSLNLYLPLYSSAINDYLRRTLKFESDSPYELLSGRVHPWDFGKEPYLNVASRLREAMIKNPNLRVLVASGQYDLATPYLATKYTINRLAISPEMRKNVTETYYPAGHMMYHDPGSRERLNQTIRDFITKNTPTTRPD
jgi:carboxypeptidase C (cathepsin A)